MESFNQNVIKHKTGLLNLTAEFGNISKACKLMGFSPDTFYLYQAARDADGVETLFEVSRRKSNLKNRVEEAIEAAVTAFAMTSPHMNRHAPATSCGSKAYLFYRLTCGPCRHHQGCGRIYQQTFVDTYSKWTQPSCARPRRPLQVPIC